jgi:basic amino acid/polyamine antiporter, APA family
MNWRIKPVDDILATAQRHKLQRSLGAMQLIMLGVGGIIGTGIFVLSAEAAQKAGPGMMLSFVIAAIVCGVTALCYAEMASMIPVAGSAYTYCYAVFGEPLAWMVGWALILEYAVTASAVAVGWSGYFVGLLAHLHELVGFVPTIVIPTAWANGPWSGGIANAPAALICLLVTWLLIIGTKESAVVNAVLVAVKLCALTAFIVLSVPAIDSHHFHPFAPNGYVGKMGVGAAAASIFFAYVGFDMLSTAAEETRNPQKNMPIGVIGALVICTVFYLFVAAGTIGTVGAQPVTDSAGNAFVPGSGALAAACQELQRVVCSREPLAFVLRQIHWPRVANLLGLAAGLALPSVLLITIFGQTRIFFAMSRDGLLPPAFQVLHRKHGTPYIVTLATGLVVATSAALYPVGRLADFANTGTLFAFLTVVIGVMVLRRREPQRFRSFRSPCLGLFGPIAIGGSLFLFSQLPTFAELAFAVWTTLGLLLYLAYGRRRSHMAQSQ